MQDKADDATTKIFEKTIRKPKMKPAFATASELPSSSTTKSKKDNEISNLNTSQKHKIVDSAVFVIEPPRKKVFLRNDVSCLLCFY